jgi:hypothetical protein
MSEINEQQNEGAETSSTSSAASAFLWQQLPYVVVLILAIAGVAYTNVSDQPLVGYWEFLALAVAVVCIVTKWPELDDRQAQFRLIWTQALRRIKRQAYGPRSKRAHDRGLPFGRNLMRGH